MINKLLQLIYDDLLDNFDILEQLKKQNGAYDAFHFGACMYLRNKYIYSNQHTAALLMHHYKTDCPDKISMHLIKDYCAIKKGSSC